VARVPAALPPLALDEVTPARWIDLYLRLGVSGVLQSTVANCQLLERQGTHFSFCLDQHHSTLFDSSHQQRLAALLGDYFRVPVTVAIAMGAVQGETPAGYAIRLRQERFEQARSSLHSDPLVQALVQQFGGVLDEESIRPKL
jgi:DNA polymerase-3 subunit gamma/tau